VNIIAMPAITVRPATEADIPALSILMSELGYPTSLAEMQERFVAIQQQADYRTLVAVREDHILGAVGSLKHYYWEQNGHFIRVQALVVSSNARRMGIGKMLMRAVEDWGRETGAVLISLNCGHKQARVAAHQFYPDIGFEHTAAGYTKWLED
jgi:GNAT superfamily N-acetyltransferase